MISKLLFSLSRTIGNYLSFIKGACFFIIICNIVNSAEDTEFTTMFDGKSLDGWTILGGTAKFTVENGTIVGHTSEGKQNTFLCKGPYSDFVLEFEVLCDKGLNSGVQIRSKTYDRPTPQASNPKRIRKKGEMYGYQCEIAKQEEGVSGNFWDEGRFTRWHDDFSNKPEAKTAYKNGEWNHYRIIAQGNHIRSWVNGIPCADFRDDTDTSGLIGFQVHWIKKGKGPFKVAWRKIRIRELKSGEQP